MIISNHIFDWLNSIPYKWQIDKVKNHFYFSDIKTNNFASYPVLSLTMSGVKERNLETNEGQVPESYEKYNLVDPKCLIFNPMDLVSGWVDVPKIEGLISPSYKTIKLKSDKMNLHFIKYYFQSLYKEKILFYFGEGVHYEYRWGLGKETLKNFPIPKPPIDEQNNIVKYLDQNKNHIEKLIEKIKRKIELLKEQRNSLINEVVTKGLNANQNTKDSKIRWIGNIPRGWNLTKMKYEVEIFGRIGFRGYTTEDIVNEGEGVITISPSNIKNDIFNLDNKTYLSWKKYHESPEIKIFKNDIILVKTGSTIGKTSIIPHDVPEMTINPQLVVLKNVKMNPKYLYYQTKCRHIKESFFIEQTGSTTPTISQEKIGEFPLIKPLLKEQLEIVDYLDEQTKLIDKSIETEKSRIKYLKEYLRSLISESVTGRKNIS